MGKPPIVYPNAKWNIVTKDPGLIRPWDKKNLALAKFWKQYGQVNVSLQCFE